MKERRLWQLGLGVVLALTFLALAVTVTLNCRPLYVYDMRAMNLPEWAGMSETEILAQYDALIAYNRLGGPATLDFPGLPSSENGLYHFAEVKTIFLVFQWMALAGTAVSAAGVWLLRRAPRPKRYLKYAGILSLALPAVVGLAAVLFWDWFFVAFHRLMFNNDYWLFDYRTDPIITLLPDTYFLHCAVLIVGLFMLGGAVCLGLYLVGRRRAGRR